MIPFTEAHGEEGIIRRFSKNVDPMELKWHWDEEDRYVEPMEGEGWMFQFDNCLPIPFISPVFIGKGKMHRIIKGTTDLVVRITKKGD